MVFIIWYSRREGTRIRRLKTNSLRSNIFKKGSKTNSRGNHSEKGSTSNIVISCTYKKRKKTFVWSAHKAKITNMHEYLR
jgi:hypothetical protein